MRLARSTVFRAVTLAFTVQAVILSIAAPATAAPAAAQAQTRGSLRANGGDRAVQGIVSRIRTDAEALRRALDNNRPRQDRTRRSPEDDVQYAVDDVLTAANHLADHSTRSQVIQLDLDDLMRRGSDLELAILDLSPSPAVRNAWSALKRDLDAAASAYGQTWDWRNPSYAPSSSGASYYERLSGTYQLDPSRSDNPRRIASQQSGNRGRLPQDLEERLDPPAVIAIERNGNEVSLASSDAPRTTFDANGRLIPERRGSRNTTTRASVYGDLVEVTTNGAGADDYTTTFEPIDGGRSMRLTRQLYVDDLAQPVVIRSMYRRTSDQPDWNVFNGRRDVVGTTGNAGSLLEDGTELTATLDTPINLRSVRENDRVTLTVHGAPEARLENAVLEGYVSHVAADASDPSGIGIVFNRIRLTNGRSADFAGTVENVRGPNGELISFDGERVESDDDKSQQAIQRGAIGGAIGAVIGAIAGGGKGAAIGAIVGAGGGAASVMIGGQRQTDLPRGTEFTVRARGTSDWNR